MASNFAVLTTIAAIVASGVFFTMEHRRSSHQPVEVARNHFANANTISTEGAASADPEIRLSRMVSVGVYEEDWISAGKLMNVGWINAFGDLKNGSSYFDRLVHHIRESPANVLLIDSISDDGLATISQMPRLRGLVIHNSNVTDAGLKHLLKMPHLETVGFYYCSVTQEGVDRIRQQMPETRFEIFVYGKIGFVFSSDGCLGPRFREVYPKKSWR
ncbi:MAG: hypothetical protein HQ518_17075 [Rhodopirellula sp.]|nr:hypothetical protein [Rhodopirellula sp.]